MKVIPYIAMILPFALIAYCCIISKRFREDFSVLMYLGAICVGFLAIYLFAIWGFTEVFL